MTGLIRKKIMSIFELERIFCARFKTIEMALNYLSKKGWHVEPVELPSAAANKAQSGSNSTTILLLSRDNSSEEEIKNMFK